MQKYNSNSLYNEVINKDGAADQLANQALDIAPMIQIGCSSESSPKQKTSPSTSTSQSGALVTCSKLTYSVKSSKNKKQWLSLVKDISLALHPGQLCAILGPSGCGKTTLLDLLAGRKTSGRIDPASQVLYNGVTPTAAYLRRHVGYVEQQDTLLAMMTPFEMLLYTAELKHPQTQPRQEKMAQVSSLINVLGLQDCKDTVIGNASRRGISGGEAKRVNIGIALITNPEVLLLDELTSGLDSFTAHGVVEVVKGIAQEGITVAATIHSPPSYTFELFDSVVLLQKGRIVYFGPNGDSVNDYFARTFPDLRPMRRSEGIADYLLDVTTRANRKEAEAAAFADAYAASDLYQRNKQIIEQASKQEATHGNNALSNGERHPGDLEAGCETETPSNNSSKELSCCSIIPWAGSEKSATVTPMWWALLVLWRYRSLKAYKRADFIAPRLFDKVMIVFLVVTLWWRVGNDPFSTGAVAAILFLWSMLTAFTSMGILPTIVLERPVYTREQSDGLYLPVTYVVYKIVEELTPQTPAGLIYSALVFYLVDLSGSFLLFWLVYLVSTANAIAMTFLVSACSRNTSVAGALLSSYATTLFFFSGFLIPYPQIVKPWQWYAVIDPLRYSFGAMMANQYGPAGGPNDPMYIGGKTILEYYGLSGVHAWNWLGLTVIFFPVFTSLLWLALTVWKHQQR